jgi:prolyl-tRNA synthetase
LGPNFVFVDFTGYTNTCCLGIEVIFGYIQREKDKSMAHLPNRETHFADWYQEVIYQAELVDQAPVRGCFVIRPYGYAIWETIQEELNRRIKSTGHENAAFPLLIPQSFLTREAEHVEGFSPELAVVTHAGGKELEEPLVVRPTSETIIHYMFARWIKSWRDLPLKINQWANVIRWEMRPRAFLRTTEFFWQEGHTAHETIKEAEAEVALMLEQYRQVYENYLAIPVVPGPKSAGEKFPGADVTMTLEAMMPDGRALQCCTSHLISRDFARAFNMTYQNRQGIVDYPYLTSWGFTTRSLGALIMMHGDNKGLVLPPKVAPLQIVIIPIVKDGADNEAVIVAARSLAENLTGNGLRVVLDEDTNATPGSKFYHWELKGVPLRVEIGPRDIAQQRVTVVDRLTLAKRQVPFDGIVLSLVGMLDNMQHAMFLKAKERLGALWYRQEKLDDFAKLIDDKPGFYQTGWCGKPECERILKDYKVSIRCVLPGKTFSSCFNCDAPSRSDVLIAKSY